MKKVLTYFKRVIGVQCPYCGGLISYTPLDGVGNLIKFVFFKGHRSTYIKMRCLKCHRPSLVNANRLLELLFILMFFLVFSFNIFGWPTLLANYKIFYVLVVLVLLIYLSVTREVIKSKKY